MATERKARWARTAAVCLPTAVLLGGLPAAALDLRPEAVGVEVDLLPTAASALDGEPGGALQFWAGDGRNRFRLVGAWMHYPDSLTSSPFEDRRNATVALLYDRFFQDGFRGPWVAIGAEFWWSSIGLRKENLAIGLPERSHLRNRSEGGGTPVLGLCRVLPRCVARSALARGGAVGFPQLVLRVGYVTNYPAPVSPRRSPAAFAQVS